MVKYILIKQSLSVFFSIIDELLTSVITTMSPN